MVSSPTPPVPPKTAMFLQLMPCTAIKALLSTASAARSATASPSVSHVSARCGEEAAPGFPGLPAARAMHPLQSSHQERKTHCWLHTPNIGAAFPSLLSTKKGALNLCWRNPPERLSELAPSGPGVTCTAVSPRARAAPTAQLPPGRADGATKAAAGTVAATRRARRSIFSRIWIIRLLGTGLYNLFLTQHDLQPRASLLANQAWREKPAASPGRVDSL
jgi:hypothetical protein